MLETIVGLYFKSLLLYNITFVVIYWIIFKQPDIYYNVCRSFIIVGYLVYVQLTGKMDIMIFGIVVAVSFIIGDFVHYEKKEEKTDE